MNTLRAKLVLLLVVVIVSVVGLLTGVLLYLLRPPGEHHIDPVAEQVIMLARIAQEKPSALPVTTAPPENTIRPAMTKWLRSALQKLGSDLEAVVSRESDASSQIVSVKTDRGWINMPIPDLPPPDGVWRVLGSWLALITLGALAIAIFVANRMIQPLVLLEKTIESVGQDALLPELPVIGPAEVKVTARALNSLSSRLKSAMESRMRLVAAAGHDMRTPITRMRIRAEFVADDEDREMWLKDLNELERIADSAILLVRDESGQSAAETFGLDDLLREVIEDLNALGYDAELASMAPRSVTANRHALSRAFRNLIINAATHGGGARVDLGTNADCARVTITDEGLGIPAAVIGQVFEPFFRADPARRQNIPGAGLGLTIAREIIRRSGGDIRIENASDKGLVQIIDLPSARRC
jgi:signal transduction histidine kinase